MTQSTNSPKPGLRGAAHQIRIMQAKARSSMNKLYRRHPRLKPFLWQRRFAPAFWTISSVVSLTVNLILIVVLIILAQQLFVLKGIIGDQLIGGLHENFVLMDDAHIKTSITVEDTILVQDTMPVVFNLPLSQNTQVLLTEDTPISGATIYLNGQPVPLDLSLPMGTALSINLDMTVPVSQTIPVVLNVPIKLEVPVDIALNETELHEPFVGLQNVVGPYKEALDDLPGSWKETPLCGPLTSWMCK